MSEFVIRRALLSDAASLSAFASDQFRATYSSVTPPQDLEEYLSATFTIELQSEEIASPEGDVLLAVFDDIIVGYAHIIHEAGVTPSAFLKRIYVDQSWKGRGIASALLTEVIAKAKAFGADRITLTVYEHNARAVAFYRKTGFTVTGKEVFHVGEDKQTDFVMEMTIA